MQTDSTPRRPAVKCICQQCSGEFFTKAAHVAMGRGKFCSQQCAGLAKRSKQTDEQRFWGYVAKGNPDDCDHCGGPCSGGAS